MFTFFGSLVEQFMAMKENYAKLENMMGKSKDASKSGQTEITKAEKVIEQIKNLFKNLEKKLEEAARKIYDKAAEGGNGNVNDLSKQMRQIAEKVRVTLSSL